MSPKEDISTKKRDKKSGIQIALIAVEATMKRLLTLTMMVILILWIALPANAQSISLKAGLFYPTAQSELWEINLENLSFTKHELSNLYIGVEYDFFLGPNFSVFFEGGTYSREILSEYRDYTYGDDTPIYQNLYLRLSNFDLGFKIFPAGHRLPLYPYLGAGISLVSWKYEQWGEFIDFEFDEVYEGFADTRTISPGANARAGLVFRFQRHIGFLVEVRYQYIKGALSSLFEGFDKLDLGGITFNVGFSIFLN